MLFYLSCYFFLICSYCFRDLKLEPYIDHYYRDYPTLVRTTGQVCTIDRGKCLCHYRFSELQYRLLVSFSVNSKGHISYC